MSDVTALEVLRKRQRQLDFDGVEVGVSRQALDEVLDEIDRLRAVLQRIADMPVDGYESTIPVRSIARVALEDDNENDDSDGTGVNTDWLRDDAGR